MSETPKFDLKKATKLTTKDKVLTVLLFAYIFVPAIYTVSTQGWAALFVGACSPAFPFCN